MLKIKEQHRRMTTKMQLEKVEIKMLHSIIFTPILFLRTGCLIARAKKPADCPKHSITM